MTSLSSVINESFILRLKGLQGSSSSGGSLAKGAGSDSVSLRQTLRFGAKTFATGVERLNYAISSVNIAQSGLDGLGKLTDDMLSLAEKAAKDTTGGSERVRLNAEYQEKGTEFLNVIEKLNSGDTKYLTKQSLKDVLSQVGLDPKDSDSISEVFDQLVGEGTEGVLISDEIQPEKPVSLKPSALPSSQGERRTVPKFSELFGGGSNILTRAAAVSVKANLEAVKDRIDENSSVLDKAVEVIGSNLDLVRSAGLAFLGISDQIQGEEDAAEVATQLAQKIREDSPRAVSQADNLELIVVAALTSAGSLSGFTNNKSSK
jgi:flagellin-like hook-associated protein FlgL